MSSGWFDCTEPSLSTSLQGKQGMQGVAPLFGVVQAHRTSYIATGETRYAGCLCTSSGWFKHVEPRRTFSNQIITEIARCLEFCHMSSGWFYCTEPSLSTSLQGKQGVQGAYALVRGGSSTSNLLEPHYYRDSNVCRVCHMSSGWFDCTEPSLSTSLQGKQGVQGAYALVRGGSSTSNLIETSRTTSLQR